MSKCDHTMKELIRAGEVLGTTCAVCEVLRTDELKKAAYRAWVLIARCARLELKGRGETVRVANELAEELGLKSRLGDNGRPVDAMIYLKERY